MKKLFRKISAFLLLMIVVFVATAPSVCEATVSSTADYGYSYTFDYWDNVQFSPDPYEVTGVFTNNELGIEKRLLNPSSLTVWNDHLFIVDTGNNRIIELKRVDTAQFEVVRIITEFKGDCEVTTFAAPSDIAVTEEGDLFIADKDNKRVVKLDYDLNLLLTFEKPVHETFDNDIDFLPTKIVCDTAGRVFCIALNVNKGIIKYEADGTYAGFVGATPVSYSFADMFWKKIATKEQRERMESFVPTEYDGIYMDHDGFIYATTTHVSENDVYDGKIYPIRKINMMGSDILIRNGVQDPIGDIHWGNAGGYTGISKLVDITVFENDTYYAIDKNRGRIFAYDDQGRLLFAFGGSGNVDGYFRTPVSIEHMGDDLVVLDANKASITLFTPTEYGRTIISAVNLFKDGKYEASGEAWQRVIELNGNYDLAYIGIGRSLLRQERYKEAMVYFKLKYDRENYSKAFTQYRKEWAAENINWIIALLLIVIFVPLIRSKIKKLKFEIDNDDYLKRNPIQ